MKLIVLKNSLQNGLNDIEKASAGENTNLPILKNVLINNYNNKIKLTATNLELAITKLISGKIVEDGSITVPLNILKNIVNNINNEKINLDAENNVLTLKTDNYQANIQGLPEEEFPIIPKIENVSNYIQINSETLKENLLKVVSAAQISDIRPEISGVLLDYQVTNFNLVATDSFRLAAKTVNESGFKSNFNKGFKAIIPLKTVQELLKILNEGPISVFIDPNQILFKTEEVEVMSRLIDGTYPDYEQIIPKSFETEILIDKEHLMSAIKLVSTFSSKINGIRLKIHDNKKTLEVYSANQYFGDNKYLIPAKINGEKFEASFNWRYLMDGLKNFSGETFFGVNGENGKAIFKVQNDPSYFYLMMPLRES